MRVMLDTNVLVSAIIFPNSQMESLILKVSLDYQLVISSYVINELLDVTKRKFPDKVKNIDQFLTRFPYELVYTPQEQDYTLFSISDKDDYPVLYTAIIEDVDVLVTGDSDFMDIEIEKPEIISPAAFLLKY